MIDSSFTFFNMFYVFDLEYIHTHKLHNTKYSNKYTVFSLLNLLYYMLGGRSYSYALHIVVFTNKRSQAGEYLQFISQ